MPWHKIFDSVNDISGIKKIKVKGKNICVLKNENGIKAFNNRCPHAGAELYYGMCENNFIICPIHRFKYNLETGKGEIGQGDYLKTYKIEERQDGIYLFLNNKWFDF